MSARSVLVTDARRGSAIAFIRSLGAKGWRVIAADDDERSAGFRSRFAAERLVYPSPASSPRAFVEALHERLSRSPVDLVIPVTDECIHPLAAARARFEGLTRLAIAPPPALETVSDKERTLDLARRLGVPFPPTRIASTTAEALRAAQELSYPLVLKPTISRRYLPAEDRIETGAVTFARDDGELAARMRVLEGRHRVLLQEYRAGTGQGVECLAHEGEVRLAFQHRRLAEIPLTGGASAWRESVPLDPVLLEHSRKLIRELSWTGLLMIEFKVGEQPWLLEINGRIWGSLPLALLSGVDFPGALAELYCPNGAAAKDPGSYRIGQRAYNLELLLYWIAQVLLGPRRHAYLPHPARSRALAGLLGLVDPAQKSDLSCSGDPSPRVAEALRIARKLGRKLTERGSP